jgi:hypothetical protein
MKASLTAFYQNGVVSRSEQSFRSLSGILRTLSGSFEYSSCRSGTYRATLRADSAKPMLSMVSDGGRQNGKNGLMIKLAKRMAASVSKIAQK